MLKSSLEDANRFSTTFCPQGNIRKAKIYKKLIAELAIENVNFPLAAIIPVAYN